MRTLRKSIDGLVMIVQNQLNYHLLERSHFKWPSTPEEALKVNIEESRWLLKGYEIRTKSKFKPVTKANYF